MEVHKAVIGAAFLCLLPLCTVAQQPDSPAPAFFTNEITILKKRIAVHEQNEAEACLALEQARKALDLAIKKNNTAAHNISRQAIALSEGRFRMSVNRRQGILPALKQSKLL